MASRALLTRLVLFGAVIGSGFGLACNNGAEVNLETYGDGAVEDYGCILGDLECECAAGGLCDAGLTCQNDVCKCLSAECALPPTTGNPGGDGDGDSMETETGEGDGDGDPTGDGDGDPTTTGDGDGDPTTTGDGDGDPTTTGDGDGDPTTTGDGDGDPTTTGDGDEGDGDPTG
jgi:hypothetical protein